MRFSQVKGQNKIINKIISLIDVEHIPHALLISGRDGYGNLALSLAIAQYISCTNKKHLNDNAIIADSCGECSSCKKYQKLIHPDLHFIFPNTTTKSIDKNNESSLFVKEFREFVLKNEGYCDLNQWYKYINAGSKQGVINVRDANNIIRSLTLKTYESKYKIMIIWNVDKMNNDASDKILKILEEPYPNTVFILTTEHRDRILPTILSRVQQINLPPIDEEELVQIIQEQDKVSKEEAIQKAIISEGNINKLKSIDDQENKEFQERFMEVNRLALKYKTSAKDISIFVDNHSKDTREDTKRFLDYFLNTIEKCYQYNIGISQLQHPLQTMEEKFKNNYPKFITINNLNAIYGVIEKAEKNIDRNANSKINLFNLVLSIGIALEKR